MSMPWINLTIGEEKTQQINLLDWYSQAVKEAKELFMLTAYLTNWPLDEQLNNRCENAIFIVGTDFGLTRKSALKKLLSWLPGNKKYALVAVDGGDNFHPKLLMWKNRRGETFIVIGSSNVTLAGFDGNVEANVCLEISDSEYKRVRGLIETLRETCTVPVTEDWIKNSYKEAIMARGGKSKERKKSFPKLEKPGGVEDTRLVLPFIKGHSAADLRKRRKQQASFAEIKQDLLDVSRECANNQINNQEYYGEMKELWWEHPSRFQGKGFHILGKGSDWSQTCRSLVTIVDAGELSLPQLDRVVCDEIDRLKRLQVSSRGSWLSEMICHFYPEHYPVLNGPVRFWLNFHKYRSPRNSSEGARYIDMALKLRRCVSETKKVSTLAEADTLIWRWKKILDENNKKQHQG